MGSDGYVYGFDSIDGFVDVQLSPNLYRPVYIKYMQCLHVNYTPVKGLKNNILGRFFLNILTLSTPAPSEIFVQQVLKQDDKFLF